MPLGTRNLDLQVKQIKTYLSKQISAFNVFSFLDARLVTRDQRVKLISALIFVQVEWIAFERIPHFTASKILILNELNDIDEINFKNS